MTKQRLNFAGKEHHGEAYGITRVEAKTKFISFEPLLGSCVKNTYSFAQSLQNAGIKWLIIGAQTNPTVMPKIEWVEEIVEAADKTNIPVFLKDSLEPLLASKIKGHLVIESHNLWAFKYFKLRQEMPK